MNVSIKCFNEDTFYKMTILKKDENVISVPCITGNRLNQLAYSSAFFSVRSFLYQRVKAASVPPYRLYNRIRLQNRLAETLS